MKAKRIKSLFEIFFDGCYSIPAQENVASTYEMGVCKLDFNENKNLLTVHLRRPGLLIGLRGRTIEGLKEYLNCEIKIVEINKF